MLTIPELSPKDPSTLLVADGSSGYISSYSWLSLAVKLAAHWRLGVAPLLRLGFRCADRSPVDLHLVCPKVHMPSGGTKPLKGEERVALHVQSRVAGD